MRIGNIALAVLSAMVAHAGLFSAPAAAASADLVAAQYHFAGATELAGNTNFDRAKAILDLPPARHFRDLVLGRLAEVYASALQFGPGPNAAGLLTPMLEDLLQAESMGSFGGHDPNRMDFVLAVRQDEKSTESWQKRLETALNGSGEPLTVDGFSGRRWNRPGKKILWLVRARDWTLVGRGEDLLPVGTDYLKHIQQNNWPGRLKKGSWLSADIDWPLLATWAPLSRSPLKLGRMVLDVTAGGGRFRATARVTYPEAVPWQPQRWRIPKGLVGSALSSFTASRDLGAYLNVNELLTRLSGDPLTEQLFCWALREMPLEDYAAWPVTDATNTLRKLGPSAVAVLNPVLAARTRTQLAWMPKENRLSWLRLSLTAPAVEAAHDAAGDFLVAKLFPAEPTHATASEQLWSQFERHDDLVYYDWELTGLRLRQWRLLSELLPVFPTPTPEEAARRQKAAQNAKPSALSRQPQTPLAVTEAWLAEMATPILGNTVTEVTRTSPTELSVARNSQFLFTGLELVLISHWLADAPVGPIDYSLLPRAKMSGPGLPAAH